MVTKIFVTSLAVTKSHFEVTNTIFDFVTCYISKNQHFKCYGYKSYTVTKIFHKITRTQNSDEKVRPQRPVF